MKRIIERRTNVDFCKRVEVWQGYRIIDRYLTAVNPRTDTPIFGKTRVFFRTLPSKVRYLDYFCRQRILPGPVIAKDYEEAMQYGEVSHHTATVTFDKYHTFKLTKL